MNRLLIVTGPTATGKSAVAVTLARKFGGELVSADSRQVYKGMDIGTGKDVEGCSFVADPSFLSHDNFTFGYYDLDGIKVWGMDIVSPDYLFNVSDYCLYAIEVISKIWERGKLPIVVGGTGQYIRELLFPSPTLHTSPNWSLREKLNALSLVELQKKLKKVDAGKWEKMNLSDRKNPRRLVRAIEVAKGEKSESLPPKFSWDTLLVVGLTADRPIITERINARVEKRISQGIEGEILGLKKRGYSWDLPAMTGMGYREFSEISFPITAESWKTIVPVWQASERQYAKRQMFYLKKFLPQTLWFDVTTNEFLKRIEKAVNGWYGEEI